MKDRDLAPRTIRSRCQAIRTWLNWCVSWGIQDTCHIFRRTFVAHATRQGVTRPFVQAVAGWSAPHMLDQYVAAMEAEQGAIEAFRGFWPFGGELSWVTGPQPRSLG